MSERYEFDRNGDIQCKGQVSSLGMYYKYKFPKQRQLPLDSIELKYSLFLDKKHNWIIDNKDTIKDFKIDLEKKMIITKKNSSVIIFEFYPNYDYLEAHSSTGIFLEPNRLIN